MSEDRPVRERLLANLATTCRLHEVFGECRACDRRADAILADADLLDDLCRERLEQVGWYRPPYATFNAPHELNPHAPDWRGGDCVPVYRFRGRTDE